MSKAVMLSIRPKWCNLIESGKKTIEVRKTRPKLDTPFKCYIYCTQDKHDSFICRGGDDLPFDVGNGMVIGEFVCTRIDRIQKRGINDNFDYCYLSLNVFGNDDIEIEITDIKKSCIKKDELNSYGSNANVLYAWHISDLVIYDQPKELCEFCKAGFETIEALDEGLCKYCLPTNYGELRCYSTPNGYVSCEGGYCCEAYQSYLDENFALTRPPQSWCYVEELEKI